MGKGRLKKKICVIYWRLEQRGRRGQSMWSTMELGLKLENGFRGEEKEVKTHPGSRGDVQVIKPFPINQIFFF